MNSINNKREKLMSDLEFYSEAMDNIYDLLKSRNEKEDVVAFKLTKFSLKLVESGNLKKFFEINDSDLQKIECFLHIAERRISSKKKLKVLRHKRGRLWRYHDLSTGKLQNFLRALIFTMYNLELDDHHDAYLEEMICIVILELAKVDRDLADLFIQEFEL